MNPTPQSGKGRASDAQKAARTLPVQGNTTPKKANVSHDDTARLVTSGKGTTRGSISDRPSPSKDNRMHPYALLAHQHQKLQEDFAKNLRTPGRHEAAERWANFCAEDHSNLNARPDVIVIRRDGAPPTIMPWNEELANAAAASSSNSHTKRSGDSDNRAAKSTASSRTGGESRTQDRSRPV
ncbi:hypothetical protein PUNSTDRAFT_44478 [Punctularia strigosozonata HHB-11173 SS5]|uniref:uncharacterized protein n=1 Tax=Punctularia strigosozonata (strain HHB-11173) TaxID=741275 RepID=UPI0004416C94|nr:uncharacterized protein PUNSTDRAFT_44478 [Punctularia strigosozonata HHB-11173 SS5]EIN09000.1 hypothetical protein PUNSTDRAFT_44478 [Punctularia strigosozonata HHB-11173 SS5]